MLDASDATCRIVFLPRYESYSSAIVWQGRATTFDCRHNHHTVQAAVRCRKTLLADWQGRANDPAWQLRQIEREQQGELFEWAKQTGTTPKGTPLGTFQRFTIADDVAIVS